MNNFNAFKTAVQQQFAVMTVENNHLYVTDTDKNTIWNTYLNSFPEGTNEIFKERREFDCQCCKAFIRKMGNVVAIVDNKLVTIWDAPIQHLEAPFDVVAKVMSRYIKSKAIRDAFFWKENKVGTDKNHVQTDTGVHTWEHFYLELPSVFVLRGSYSIATKLTEIRDDKNIFQRSLKELTLDASQTILELIEQGSLYRGAEYKDAINKFISAKIAYDSVADDQKDIWCWDISRASRINRIRNTAIGTLLINLSKGMELDAAVGKFESVVAPTNYKRPKAIFTKRMIDDAEKKIVKLGYMGSLGRKHAVLDDITVNDVLFLNRHAKKTGATVFDEMASEAAVSPKNFSKLEEIGINDFINNILPSSKSIQLMMENKHQGNLISLIAPQDIAARSMFKWDNNFSWSYNGDIADSMKDNVKAAGGSVTGVLRFSIQWNDGDNNRNDFDAHCIEPSGNTIMFNNMWNHSTRGNLDVDITNPGSQIAVENITWPTKSKMAEGEYRFLVHNYSHNGGTTGFTAEIEYDGKIYSYTYDKELRQGEKVDVATLTFSKTDGIKFIKSLDSQYSQKELWGIKTNSFVEVASLMRSPNYWEGEGKQGNEHYFFFLNGCVNQNNPRGFYNEFLKESLLTHKHVFEALGSKMRVEHSNDQLSGLGFSTTQRNSIIAKVEGSFNRTIKINF